MAHVAAMTSVVKFQTALHAAYLAIRSSLLVILLLL
jgi:hypothetical protein